MHLALSPLLFFSSPAKHVVRPLLPPPPPRRRKHCCHPCPPPFSYSCLRVYLFQKSKKRRIIIWRRRFPAIFHVIPAAGLRQFCVEIAPPYDRRNIDAALLREHSVRRICAHYKVCKFCVISSFASTHASNLREKNSKKLAYAPKKSI